MANTYVINTVTEQGDTLTVTGTVNGIPVTINTWISAAGGSLGSTIAFENFIAPLMLAALPSAPTVLSSLQGLNFSK